MLPRMTTACSRLMWPAVALLLARSSSPVSLEAPSKFAKYQKVVQLQQIDWLVLQANVEAVRLWVDSPLPFINSPRIAFERKEQRIDVFINVDADELSKLPVEDVKSRLQWAAFQAGAAVRLFMDDVDELKGREFYVRFRGLSIQGARKNLPITTFAEFKDGQVILH